MWSVPQYASRQMGEKRHNTSHSVAGSTREHQKVIRWNICNRNRSANSKFFLLLLTTNMWRAAAVFRSLHYDVGEAWSANIIRQRTGLFLTLHARQGCTPTRGTVGRMPFISHIMLLVIARCAASLFNTNVSFEHLKQIRYLFITKY
jgi:hypothetical protein